MYKAILIAVLLKVVFIYPLSALANDGFGGYDSGGIILIEQEDISMEKEVLTIDGRSIEVSYVFKNHTDNDITALVVFPFPEYDMRRIEETDGTPGYDSFTVYVNGISMDYKKEIKAFCSGEDVTFLLLDAGLEDCIDINYECIRTWKKRIETLDDDSRNKLIDAGLIVYPGNDWDTYNPKWKVVAKFYWEQSFPANDTITVRHTYGGYPGGDISGASNLSYILTTATTWRMPIRDFQLSVKGWKDIAGVSGGTWEEGRYVVRRKDFTPTGNLEMSNPSVYRHEF